MNTLTQGFALLAALLHVYIFCMESLWFMQPKIYKSFGATSKEDAESKRLFAFNQGFYNLFLALGIFIGLILIHVDGMAQAANALVLFGCASMALAGLVLVLSAGARMWRPALIQAIFPVLAWGSWWLLG